MRIKPRDQVVVSKSPDTIVYTVRSISDGIAQLIYGPMNRRQSGGIMPIDALMRPTREQLTNNGRA